LSVSGEKRRTRSCGLDVVRSDGWYVRIGGKAGLPLANSRAA